LELSAEDAFKVIQETDEEEAVAMARRGDTSLFNKYVEACNVLVKKGQMDASAIPTLEDIGVVQ
jgi:hypothetical protein